MFDKNFRIFLVLTFFIIVGFIFYTIRLSRGIETSALLNNAVEPIVAARPQKIDASSLKDARLSLLAPSLQQIGNIYQAKKGDTFPIDIILASGNTSIDGVDAHISYNPLILKVVNIDTASSLFAAFPSSAIDEKNGIISLSALSAPNTSINESGKVAALIVKALASGTSAVEFVFTPNDSTDTNVAEHGTGKDALGNVEDITITIL